jgi:fatty-acyl-CoA synthase
MVRGPLMIDTASTLWRRWNELASQRPAEEIIVHWAFGTDPFRWSWGSLLEQACRYATLLAEAGVKEGDVCTLILRHHRDFYPLYMGVEALGALPSVLAYPNPRLHPDKFRHGLEGMARHSGLDWLLTEKELEPTVRPLALGERSTIKAILFPLEWTNPYGATGPSTARSPESGAQPADPCLLQHSSGTTGLQKGVMLSHRAVLEHVVRYAEAIALEPGDKIVSWLPLYHDMGLIASFHLPLAYGIPFIQIDPFEWVTAPVLLLEAASQEKATLAWLPNFSYNFMADRIHDEDLQDIRLDSIRMLINCSEPVRSASHEKFARRFEAHGFRRKALAACYAMAETTFAVTQSAPGEEVSLLEASRDELARGRFAPPGPGQRAAKCVSSGRPISGCEVRIVDDQRNTLPEGHVGEIMIRSVSMFGGYRNNPEKTAEVLRDGWCVSGDNGFLWKGECFVLGREKDILIVAGKNIYPEDIEYAIAEVPGVVPGRVVAFGVEDEESGTEQVCVVTETPLTEPGEKKALRMAVVQAGMAIDVSIGRVYLSPQRWLFKSSAGKLSRSTNRQRALEELSPVS